ncbi:MAG: MoaD/ThiS family protein [Chloroflexota bacterium]
MQVRYGTTLAEPAGAREVEVTLSEAECTLLGLLTKLAASGPRALARELLDTQTGRPVCLVTVNGRLVAPTAVTAAALQDGDRVALIAPMSGGSRRLSHED